MRVSGKEGRKEGRKEGSWLCLCVGLLLCVHQVRNKVGYRMLKLMGVAPELATDTEEEKQAKRKVPGWLKGLAAINMGSLDVRVAECGRLGLDCFFWECVVVVYGRSFRVASTHGFVLWPT